MQMGLPFRRDDAAAGGSAEPGSAPPDTLFIRRSRARRYVLRVDPDGRVRVTIPRGGSRREATAFIARHARWIAQQRARVTPSRIPERERRHLRDRARVELPQRLLALAARYQLVVSSISIRDQRTRWGSCGRNGHVCLNWRLVSLPPSVRDYVLIHELMHLHRLDHSAAYWKLVEIACPGYREARQWLRRHGPSFR
jgi:predicted metal-dependent hydrolase